MNLPDFNIPSSVFDMGAYIRVIEKEEKHHTIRAGNRIKPGDPIQLAVWSGRPYHSPVIRIASPFMPPKIIDIHVATTGLMVINGQSCGSMFNVHNPILQELAHNDGLLVEDFIAWFTPSIKNNRFDGQIIFFTNKEASYS